MTRLGAADRRRWQAIRHPRRGHRGQPLSRAAGTGTLAGLPRPAAGMLLTALLAIGFYRMRLGAFAARACRTTCRACAVGRAAAAGRRGRRHQCRYLAEFARPGLRHRDVITVDARWAGMLGRDAGELNPLSPARFYSLLVHPDDVAVVQAVVGRAMREQGHVISFDVRLRHMGRPLGLDRSARQGGGARRARPPAAHGGHADGRQRAQGGRTRPAAERGEFPLAVRARTRGICQVEQPGGRFLMVNNSLVQSTGYSREELLRMTFWDITPPEWHEAERLEAATHTHAGDFGPTKRNTSARMAAVIHCWSPARTCWIRRAAASAGHRAGHLRTQGHGTAAGRCGQPRPPHRPRQSRAVHDAAGEIPGARARRAAAAPGGAVPGLRSLQAGERCHGHEAGDGLLREIAARLRHELGVAEDDLAETGHTLVARFGGDEFLVLLNDIADDARRPRGWPSSCSPALPEPTR